MSTPMKGELTAYTKPLTYNQRTIDAARANAYHPQPDHVSGELIAPGIVRLTNGVSYFSPAAMLRAAAEIANPGPVPAHLGDAIAAVLGRMMEMAR
jgi:hypothetical protein